MNCREEEIESWEIEGKSSKPELKTTKPANEGWELQGKQRKQFRDRGADILVADTNDSEQMQMIIADAGDLEVDSDVWR